MILPPVTMEEQIAFQRETKARTILLQSLLEDHIADFHHLDDAKDIWLAVKARFVGNEESKKMRKSMLKQDFGTLEIDVKGVLSYDSRVPAAPTHSAFISAASTNSKWSTADSKCQPSSVSYTATSSLLMLQAIVGDILQGMYRDEGYGDDAVDAADGVITDGIFADGVFVATGNGSVGVFVAAGVGADGVSVTSSDATDAKTQFALMGLSPQVQLEESEARSDEVFDLSAPSIFDSCLKDALEKHTTMTVTNVLTTQRTPAFASCVSSVKSSSLKTKDQLASTLFSLLKDFTQRLMTKGPCNVHSKSSFSFKEIYCDFYENQLRLNNAPVWKNVENIPSFVPRPAYVPAGSRNRPTSVPAGRPFPLLDSGDVETSVRPQQVVLGKVTGHICIGDPRTMDNPHTNKDLGIVDSGCSRSMTGNKEKLADFVKIKGGTVTFGGGDGKITGKGTIRTSNFHFENVYYVEELQNFNLFSVSQICDTKHKIPTKIWGAERENRDPYRVTARTMLATLSTYLVLDRRRSTAVMFKQVLKILTSCRHTQDSDSECDDQVDLLQGVQAYEAILQQRDTLENSCYGSDGSGVLLTRIPVLVLIAVGGSDVPSTPSSSVVEPVHANTPLPPGHSLGSSENSTRFFSPSDLVNQYHHIQKMMTLYLGILPQAWCDEFEVLMKGEFEMSAMGELTFFLGLQVTQKPDGIFISQDKYVQDILKKFDMESIHVVPHVFEASRQDISLQPTKTWSMVPKRFSFMLEAYTDSDYAGSHDNWFISVVLHEESGIILMINIHSGWLSVCLLVREFLLVALNVPTARTIPAGFQTTSSNSPSTPVPTLNRILVIIIQMADLKYHDEHNKVGFLEKPKGSADYHQGPLFSIPTSLPSSSRTHVSKTKTNPLPLNVEDDVFGGSLISHLSGSTNDHLQYTQVVLWDPDKLTALCSLVNSLVQKTDSQAFDLKAHKLVFKEVVGKLVKKVKELEDKLQGRKRKFVMTESDIEEEEEQDVDPLIKLAKAAATAAADSVVPTGGSNEDDIPPSSSTPSDAFAGGSANYS
ncbi:putative ribonuclease H-like domain-containing protein [Tanacetum coccineum]|uniref:Ribonuclease H-like domain-containing protein n=1 Tax=Tanacetum coccineum TaxID=301880 RepID=A0ABQ5J1A6_9ASTR